MRKKAVFLSVIVFMLSFLPTYISGISTPDSAVAENTGLLVSPTRSENPAIQERSQLTLTAREKQLLDGAAERINQYRKGNSTIYVVDSDGKPLSNAIINVEMLNHDFLFGCNSFRIDRCGSDKLDKAYEDAFAGLFNYATLPFYWSGYGNIRGGRDIDGLKYIAEWAQAHNIKTKGHPLVWASHMVPDRLPGDINKLDKVVEEHITDVTKEFDGLIDFWDVINEPVVASSVDNPIGKWTKTHTPATSTAMALDWAHNASPGASMLVNDYRTDDAFHQILGDAKAEGGEFNAVGLQSHMHKGTWPLDKVWDVCEKFSDFGVPIHFTEVTVLSGALKTDDDWSSFHSGWKTTDEGEAIQANYVEALYTLLFSNPSVEAITWWELSDLGDSQGAPSGLLRKDMSPKPAYDRLKNLIHEQWWTRTNLLTDPQGTANWQGFYGEYSITISIGSQKVNARVHLEKGQDNIFTIKFPGDTFMPAGPGI
jgi:endo-1,4-beta-xylanase